jgi:dolichyl-phosphate-mannose--protein O-mannosyl transferase
MSGEFYVEIMGCVLITAFTGLVIACAVWFANFVYGDVVEKRKWRNRK